MFGLGLGLTDSSVIGGGGGSAFDPLANFAPVIYTGNASTQSITGVGFQPDLVWIKSRGQPTGHRLFDVVRGATNYLNSSNDPFAIEVTDATTLTSFDSDGFTIGNNGDVNLNGWGHVAWCWKAGSTPVSNTDGFRTATVSANQAAGFSVVTYSSGTGTNQSVGHGLSSAPEIVIYKSRNNTTDWRVQTTVIDGSHDLLVLNSTAAKADLSSTTYPLPTATTIASSYGGGNNVVAYCFHSVPGYSKIGTYTGNGSATGPIVTTGFQPRFVMIKRATNNIGQWGMYDTVRGITATNDKRLYANLNSSESSGSDDIDLLADGFQIQSTSTDLNASGSTYLYMAFA